MNNIKFALFNRFKTLSVISVSIAFSIFILMVRIKLTHSSYFLFLVWNLFLAIIPFAITTYLTSIPKPKSMWVTFWFGIWLLFLPNAPYILTDLIHLRRSFSPTIWLDILTVTSFAFAGLLLFYASLVDMIKMLNHYIKAKFLTFFTVIIVFLSAFGVYLGRFLRYNSWEIVSNPKYLFEDIIIILLKPLSHVDAWLFIVLFGTFLNLGLWVFNNSKKAEV